MNCHSNSRLLTGEHKGRVHSLKGMFLRGLLTVLKLYVLEWHVTENLVIELLSKLAYSCNKPLKAASKVRLNEGDSSQNGLTLLCV